MARKQTRRAFLGHAAAAGAGFWISTRAPAQSTRPAETLHVA
ncbi:MAG: twin-arginine translocation signal domain-containing protein, partial [Phycisphaerae bacterium]